MSLFKPFLRNLKIVLLMQKQCPMLFYFQAEIKASYGNRIKEIFNAEPYKWDFLENQEKALKTINVKVNKHSRGQIKKFLDPGKLPQIWHMLQVFATSLCNKSLRQVFATSLCDKSLQKFLQQVFATSHCYKTTQQVFATQI